MKAHKISTFAAMMAVLVAGMTGCSNETDEEATGEQPAELEGAPELGVGPGKASAKGLRMFDEADKDQDGKVTKDEVRAAATAKFTAADANKDGFLDPAEMKNLKKQFKRPGKGKGDRFAKKLQRMDKDGNGTISREEAPPRLADRFDSIDANKNGELEQDEFRAHRKQGRGKFHGKRMAKMDVDGDGKLSAAEFVDGAIKKISRADANGDGVLTREEAQNHRGMRHGKRMGRMGGKGRMGRMGHGPEKAEQLFAEADVDKDGQVTQPEMTALRQKHFAAADTNSDKVLDEAEMKAWGAKHRTTRVTARLKQLDKDNDGKVSREEAPPRMLERFATVDGNKDGFVTADEMVASGPGKRFGKMGKGPGHLSKLDKDGDGNISAEEFSAKPTRWFSRADADGDGAVTLEELKTKRFGAKWH